MLNKALPKSENEQEMDVPQSCRRIRPGFRVEVVQVAHEVLLIEEVVKLSAAELHRIDQIKSMIKGWHSRGVCVVRRS